MVVAAPSAAAGWGVGCRASRRQSIACCAGSALAGACRWVASAATHLPARDRAALRPCERRCRGAILVSVDVEEREDHGGDRHGQQRAGGALLPKVADLRATSAAVVARLTSESNS